MRPPVDARAIVTLLLVALLFGAPVAALAQAPPTTLHGDSWAAVRAAGHGTLVIPFYYPLEGFSNLDASGHPSGLLIEMIEQFRSYLKNVRGVDVQLQMVPYKGDFPRFYGDVRQGQGGVIGLAGTTITAERKKEIQFGPPFFTNVPVLITHKSVPDIPSRDRIPVDLAGFSALAFRGTTDEAVLQRLKAESFPALRIEPVADFHDIVRRIAADPKLFTCLDLNIFWIERKLGAPIKRQRAGDQPREDFGFILPLSSDWGGPLADFFAANGGYRKSNAYRQLMIKHLGVDLKELLEPGGA